MSQDDKNRSWCHGEGTKREVSRARRLSSDFGQFLARRTDYESHQAKLRAAASSDTLAFDALNAQLSQVSKQVYSTTTQQTKMRFILFES